MQVQLKRWRLVKKGVNGLMIEDGRNYYPHFFLFGGLGVKVVNKLPSYSRSPSYSHTKPILSYLLLSQILLSHPFISSSLTFSYHLYPIQACYYYYNGTSISKAYLAAHAWIQVWHYEFLSPLFITLGQITQVITDTLRIPFKNHDLCTHLDSGI